MNIPPVPAVIYPTLKGEVSEYTELIALLNLQIWLLPNLAIDTIFPITFIDIKILRTIIALMVNGDMKWVGTVERYLVSGAH